MSGGDRPATVSLDTEIYICDDCHQTFLNVHEYSDHLQAELNKLRSTSDRLTSRYQALLRTLQTLVRQTVEVEQAAAEK